MQISLYYVSEGHVLTSISGATGEWSRARSGGLASGKSGNYSSNYSTALNTRSLSITSTGSSSDTDSPENSALLYYENPFGKVSALLRHGWDWVDITDQESKSLPGEFRNAPDVGISKTLYESLHNNTSTSTPFTSGANWIGQPIAAVFYAPPPSNNNGLPFSTMFAGYDIGPTNSGYFIVGMHCAYSYPKWSFSS